MQSLGHPHSCAQPPSAIHPAGAGALTLCKILRTSYAYMTLLCHCQRIHTAVPRVHFVAARARYATACILTLPLLEYSLYHCLQTHSVTTCKLTLPLPIHTAVPRIHVAAACACSAFACIFTLQCCAFTLPLPVPALPRPACSRCIARIPCVTASAPTHLSSCCISALISCGRSA